MPTDPFLEMVAKKAQVKLPLGEFDPVSCLRVPEHEITWPAAPVIDMHCHVDGLDLEAVVKVMDACRIEHMVNISLAKGGELDAIMRKFAAAPAGRFTLFVLLDPAPLARNQPAGRLAEELERRVEQGARGLKVWKDVGLTARDSAGQLLRLDDERFAAVFEKAAEIGIPVMLHTADPAAFFLPIDARNERYEELAAHPDWGFHGAAFPSKAALLEQRDRVLANHPRTAFLGAHVGSMEEDLEKASQTLERFPNFSVDISARAAELGRQPRTARGFFLRYPERILFGSDLIPEISMYRLYYRMLETADEYFPYPTHESGQGRWRIYGLELPVETLRKVYSENAQKFLVKI